MMWTRLSALIVKELLAAFRDPRARIALILPPLIQFFLFAYAATLEVSNVPVGVLNEDWGMASTQLIARFERASAFSEIRRYASPTEAQAAIDRQDVMVVVHIGQDFSRKLASGEAPKVQLLLDGRKSNSAQLVNSYIGTIISQFGADYARGTTVSQTSEIVDRTWYNPNREYQTAMVPTLIGTLTMATVLMIVGMSVARERELGTFEQLLVSPLQPLEIIVGKAVPGLIVGLGQAICHHDCRHAGFRDRADRLRVRAVHRPDRVPAGGDRRRAVHIVARFQPAAGDDGHHGLHDACDDAVGIHRAGPEHADLAAAGRAHESADPFHRYHTRCLSARHAVLARCRTHLAYGCNRCRHSFGRRLAVPAQGAMTAAPDQQRP